MKEEYRGYRPGDRVQMVECNDPYAPVLPGGERHHRPYRRRRHAAHEVGRRANARRVPRGRHRPQGAAGAGDGASELGALLQCDESRWEAHCEQAVD